MKRFVVWNNYGVRTYKFINLFMIDSITSDIGKTMMNVCRYE